MMRIVKYQRGDISLLKKLANKYQGVVALRYPEFVDYYYGSSEWGYMLLVMDNDDILAVGGFERMRLEVGDKTLTVLVGSNWYAFQRGEGAALLLHWLKSADGGLAFGGSEDTRRILSSLKCTRYWHIPIFEFNRTYEIDGAEPWWKRSTKALSRLRPKVDVAKRARRVLRQAASRIDVREERRFSAGLLPSRGPFTLRPFPTVDYLNWRYNTGLSFVRYRLFRILCSGTTVGYVVINELPDQILIAHCDGEDARLLTRGIVAALAVVCCDGRRHARVVLSCSHTAMQRDFLQFGFRRRGEERPLFFAAQKKTGSFLTDTSQWLVNFDWGDNGLRPPFLGQPHV